jgi:hypothetical protein
MPFADCSALDSLRSCRAWIAPCSTLKAFAPVTDCSVLDAGRLVRPSDCSSVRFLPLCAACGLLRICRLTLRDGLQIALYATTLRPRVVHGLLRAQHFKLRTGHRLLCVRRLAVCAACGLLRSPHSAPCVARGLLRAQHLEFCAAPVVLRARHLSLRPVHRLLCVRHLTLRFSLRIAPPASVIAPVLIADCSVLNTYAPRWDLLINLSESSRMKMFRSI